MVVPIALANAILPIDMPALPCDVACMGPPPLFRRRLACRGQWQDLSSLGWTRRAPSLGRAQVGNARDQFRIAAGKARLVELNVVLEAGADVPAELQTPFIDFELLAADAGGGPGGVGNEVLEFADEEFEQLSPRRQSVWNAHDELHVAWALEQAAVGERLRVVEHRDVEHLDLWLYIAGEHRACEVLHELRRILVDLLGEVYRAGRERRHIRLEVEHFPALALLASAPAGRELDDHAGTVSRHALLHSAEQGRIGTRALVGIANVDVNDGSARFKGFLRRLDLLGRAHRDRGCVGLAWDRSGDRNGDDRGSGHAGRAHAC